MGSIEEIVFKGQFRQLPDVKGGVGVPSGQRRFPGQFDHGLLPVDPVKLAGGDGLGQPHRNGPISAAEVKDAEARLKMRQQVSGAGFRAAPTMHVHHLIAVAQGIAVFA